MANYVVEASLHCLTWGKKNRSRLEIMASMIEAVKEEGTTRYSLMKNIGSNFVEVNKYLESLTDIGFIETGLEDGQVLYRASERGIEFLRQYYVLLGMILSTRARENMGLPKYIGFRQSQRAQ